MVIRMVRTIGREPDAKKRIRSRQGKAIREVRSMRGMGIAELAEAVGVTEGSISHWEMGRYSPRQHHQVALANALEVPWSTLFGLDGEVA